MTFEDPEVELAELFESLVHREFGITPGERIRSDASGESGLRVDFLYESPSDRPMALEATTMPLGELQPADASGDHWSRDLDEVVRTEQLGSWIIHFTGASRMGRLQTEVVEALRSRTSGAYYDSDGRFTLLRNEAGTGDGVYYFAPSSEPAQPTGFTRQLLVTAVENAPKLREARPRATHLMVLVGSHRSRDPSLTLVPPSAEDAGPLGAIDWIWITFDTGPIGPEGAHPWIWWAQPGDHRWETHTGPL